MDKYDETAKQSNLDFDQEIAKVYINQFAITQQSKEKMVLQVASILSAVLSVFFYALYNFMQPNGVLSISYVFCFSSVVVSVLLSFGAHFIIVSAYGWRRDQLIVWNFIQESKSKLLANIFPLNYDPRTSFQRRNMTDWLPESFKICYFFITIIQVILVLITMLLMIKSFGLPEAPETPAAPNGLLSKIILYTVSLLVMFALFGLNVWSAFNYKQKFHVNYIGAYIPPEKKKARRKRLSA